MARFLPALRAVMATSEPTPVPAVNYKYALGKVGKVGGHIAHMVK